MLHLPFFTNEHRNLAGRLANLVSAIQSNEAPRDETDTRGNARRYVQLLRDQGWLDVIDPGDIRLACLIRAGLANSSSLADTMFAMQGLGGLPIAMFGTASQRRQWFARIQKGAVGAFALTEPDAGSDPAGMTLAAKRRADGYVLRGEKTFISNAGLADIYVVFARTADGHDNAHTAFIVPGDARGLSAEPIALIAPHPIGTLRFDDVRVPLSHRLGAEGDGLRVALGTLDRFRPTVGAAACGMARRALDEALAHVQKREQFGRPLAKFQAVQFMLAEMATELAAAELLVARAAWMVDTESAIRRRGNGRRGKRKGGRTGVKDHEAVKQAVSMAKLYATDHAHAIIDKAVQLLGGRGLVHGHPVERLYREVRALRIYEGTSEIQKLVIARTLIDAG